MPGYIPFTEEQKLQAARVDLPTFLAKQGIELVRSGREYKLAANPYIHVSGNGWFDHAEGKGGNPISFVRRFHSLSYPEAVTLLLDGRVPATFDAGDHAVKQKQPKPFVLPPAHNNMRGVYAYLTKQRGIPSEIVTHFARAGMLYESAEPSKDGAKVYHNAVFVGHDRDGTPRHAHKHGIYSSGPSYKGNIAGSDPAYSFHHIGASDRLLVFEAPIDLLSFITLYPKDWLQHSFVALCGISEHAMLRQLGDNPQLSKVTLCLDNDEAGLKGAHRLAGILWEKGYGDVDVLLPNRKDWNEGVSPEVCNCQSPS